LECAWVKTVIPVETNIVVIVLEQPELRDVFIQRLAEQQIKTVAFGPGMIRMVTHLDIDAEQIDYVLATVKKM